MVTAFFWLTISFLDIRAVTFGSFVELNVKILTQRREHSLRRLLLSLEEAKYSDGSVLDVEIFVDNIPKKNSWSLWSETRRAKAERKRVLEIAKEWASSGRWRLGEVKVIDSPHWLGVRESWFACSNPELSGEEYRRFIILEDDVELSQAWFEFYAQAVARYAKVESIAGIALQRQASRLDLDAEELGHGQSWRQKPNKELAPLDPNLLGDQVYLFSHVGSWGFAPEPRVWAAFLRWFKSLEDPNAVETWSLSTNGKPRSNTITPFFESLPSRWYRSGLSKSRSELDTLKGGPLSMWTTHFDVFCARHGLFVIHPHFSIVKNEKTIPVALAASWRENGEHFQSLKTIDTELLSIDDWYIEFANKSEEIFPRAPIVIMFSGEKYSEKEINSARNRYYDQFLRRGRSMRSSERVLLDADWQLDESLLLSNIGEAMHGAFGTPTLKTFTQEEAYCILDGKKVVILGDSITRYFTFTLNYFLKFGTVNPEFGEINGGCETWGCATRNGNVYTDSDYFDQAEIWGSGTDRSSNRQHRQHVKASFNDGAIETDFYFITDTWFDELATLAEELRNTHDVAIVNSGWWELLPSTDDHSGTPCETVMTDVSTDDVSPFYSSTGDCLNAYESDLESMVNNFLRYFSLRGDGAALWRSSICCGFDITTSNSLEIQRGSIAVQAMNTVAEKVMLLENGVEVINVYPFSNMYNTGIGDPDDPEGRTWDGSHPRATYNFLWVMLILNKIAVQLNRVDSCLAVDPTAVPTYTKTSSPTTPAPSVQPTTAAPIGSTCDNGVTDGDETDIDCGGGLCPKCTIEKVCVSNSDCASAFCLGSKCVGAPTTCPSNEPTIFPTSSLPSVKPSSNPTRIPIPFPTRAPTSEDRGGSSGGGGGGGGGGGNSYGNEENVRQEKAFSIGNTTFNCFAANDGVTYEISRFAFDHCPTGGQKLLLAALVAVIISHIYAYIFLQEPKSPEASLMLQSKNNTGISLNGVRLEDELSGSALRVLKHMETLEEEIKSPATSPQPMHSHHPRNSVQDDQTNFSGIELGHFRPEERASKFDHHSHTSGNPTASTFSRAASHHPHHAHHARTNISLVNRSLAYTGHNHSRVTTYTEPHLQTHGHRSSVAFSFYDGGDSEDESEDGEEDAPLQIERNGQAATSESAPVPIPSVTEQKEKSGKTFAATSSALGFAVLLGICVLGEKGMPSGLLPAASVSTTENIDLFTFIVVSLFLVSLINIEELDDGSDVFLSRAVANEWKGWMQVAFVAYHYTNAQDVYVPIRWCVSAYVWLTGFGNGFFFWSSSDFSFKRFIQQIWRMNFLAMFLSLATGTPWIEYYFVALANVHFVIIFFSLGAARLVGMIVRWPKPNRKEKVEACISEKLFGCAIVLAVDLLFWLVDDRGDGEGAYDVLLRPWLIDISEYTEWYFYLRTKMDYLSSFPGLLFAVFYTPFRDAWPNHFETKWIVLMYLGAATLLIVAIHVSSLKKYCCDNGAEYRKVNAYIGTLWIPFYLLVRHATPWLSKRVAKPIEWIGMHSLEFYLLQFHVFLTNGSKRVLYIIPHEDWGLINMAITSFIYVCLSTKALELTNALRAVAWRASKVKVIITGIWSFLGYVLLADKWNSTKCDAYTWTLWLALSIIAIIFLLIWTITA